MYNQRIIHQGQALRVYSKNLPFFKRVFFGKTLLYYSLFKWGVYQLKRKNVIIPIC